MRKDCGFKMLRIVLGAYPDEKLNMYAKEIKTLLKENKNVTAVVPDQFSFEFDRVLYSKLGPRDFNRVKVLSFKKLSEEVILSHGRTPGVLIRQEERCTLIYLALKKVKAEKSLKSFSKAADKPSFAGEISSVLDSLIRSGLEPSALYDCSQRLKGAAADKLFDVAAIYEAYLSELKKRGLRDDSSVVSMGAELIKKSGYFKNTYVYIDRFDSYSPDEIRVIEAAVADAASVTVSLTLPENAVNTPVSVYSQCFDTQKKLVGIAKNLNKGLSFVNCEPEKEKQNDIARLGEILSGVKIKNPESRGGISVISCGTVFEETDFAAAMIRKLASENKYTYNDIALITHDISAYRAALESSFDKYDIPYFIDGKRKASDMSVMLFAFAAIDAAYARKPDTDRIMKTVRSPFSSVSEEEVSLIEDYCVRWNVDGDMWLNDFTAGAPDELEKLNGVRKKIIEPIIKLKEDSKNTSARRIASAFNRFIESCGLAERAKSIIEDCVNPDEKLEAARVFKQLWNALMTSVAAIYDAAGDEKITLREFGELLKLSLGSCGISNPPQKLSGIIVSDVARSVIMSPKIAFVLGVNDGAFPAYTKKSGIFSGRDVELYESEGLCFETSDLKRMDIERFDCFRALYSADERLYISYSQSDTAAKPLRPSPMVKKIIKALKLEEERSSDYPAEMYVSTPKAAFYKIMLSDGADDETETVRSALRTVPEYQKKLDDITGRKENSGHSLSPQTAKRLFAPGDINVTASRIDLYNKCPFEYFMQYGIKAVPVTPIKLDPANRGSVMHFIFQSVLEYFGEKYETASDSEIEALITELMADYREKLLGGDFGKSAKFRADYERIKGASIEILKNIREEYKISKFRPVRFEYSLTRENGESVLQIPINSGLKINIRGVVDRVDLYSDGGREYIRIVDYKTGSKELKFADIYNGLNLQLLLYMTALTDGSDKDFKDCVPAGVLYMKAGFLECSEDYSPVSDEAASRLKRSSAQLKRSGLIIEDDTAIDAMDGGVTGRYIPVTRNKDGSYSARSSVISKESFRLLQEFAKRKVEEFGLGLISGRIDAVPCGKDSEHLVCAYCDYQSVCDRKKYIFKKVSNSDGEKLDLEIKGGGRDA